MATYIIKDVFNGMIKYDVKVEYIVSDQFLIHGQVLVRDTYCASKPCINIRNYTNLELRISLD